MAAKKSFDLNPIYEAAHEVQSFCIAHRWKLCFIGGVAVQRWGEPRVTLDADLTLLTGFGDENNFIKPLLEEFGIEGVISVQARTDEVENAFLLDYAKTFDFVRGVVGWFDLTTTDVADKIARFAANPKAVGVREVLEAHRAL